MIMPGLKNELSKILSRRKYQVMLALTALFCLLFGILSVNTINVGPMTLSLPTVIFSVLSPLSYFILPLVIFMLAADLYTHELENKTIKCVITRPVSRFAAYLSKALAITCYTGIMLGVAYAVTGVFQMMTDGGLVMMLQAALAYLVTLLPILGFVSLASMVSVAIPNPSMSMFLSIIAYVLMLVAGLLWNFVGAALFTSYLGWYKMWMGVLQFDRIVITTALILSLTTLFFIFGHLMFDRKDV